MKEKKEWVYYSLDENGIGGLWITEKDYGDVKTELILGAVFSILVRWFKLGEL
jgi:hypothetical protein